ncbi:MAG TPA: hypothetical protein DCE41_02130 [Cytophagales bacterium]|nr:hypothetical protein [Cytophagales bacterium]HAA21262.1 hypothetical protein [Cytophagales bacterium]HAP63487.1 hypothetical protein [Cytophagales bacterium]
MNASTQRTGTLVGLISLFFLWGLLTSLNDILVPYFKAHFELPHWLAQFVQLFFFLAYLIMSFPSGRIIQRVGYQKGIVMGLGGMALGCLIFYPAAMVGQFWMFLLGLFVLATGITILQVAANPYVVAIGDEAGGASRLNLAQGFNSLGHVLAPLVGTVLILQEVSSNAGLETVQVPYLILAGILIAGAFVFSRLSLPNLATGEVARFRDVGAFLKENPVFVGSMLAIFCYVGAEIAVGSVLVNYFQEDKSIALPPSLGGFFVSLYWGSAMLGRFLGAWALRSEGKPFYGRMVALALAAIAVLWFIASRDVLYDYSVALGLSVIVLVNLLAFLALPKNPAVLLSGFALANIVLLVLTMTTSGSVALYSVLGVGLFNSIMWSNIFALAIKGLGKRTTLASALLVAMIAGGAILPPLQGALADAVSLKLSFLVPLLAYVYLAWYGRSKAS